MFNRLLPNILIFLFALLAGFILILVLIRITFILQAIPKISNLENVPSTDTAIIFGAGLQRDGSPTPVLEDRIKAGFDLYLSGKVKKLLLTGDNQFADYNEPAAMAGYAKELGIPSNDLIIDNGGKSTFDSCLRAKNIFGIKKAILVSQSFHLPRALFICGQLGIESQAVSADLHKYRLSSLIFWNLRELPAGFMALFDTWFQVPKN